MTTAALTTAMHPMILGHSAAMRAVSSQLRVIVDSDSTVVITGETGTGKELTARMIHHSSRRRHRPFVVISCALFADSLIESELFGHDRGAFTGAVTDRPGRFETAAGGTVFLDDIDDVPVSMQVKLLRVLQNRTVERLGSSRTIPVDVRVLAGTKRDLKQLVRAGSFREDLFYRLNVLPVVLPPLRERLEDIGTLMERFLTIYFTRRDHDVPSISPEVIEAFGRHDWPGNVRELEHVCERIAQTCTCPRLRLGCVSTILPPRRDAVVEDRAEPPVTHALGSAPIHLDRRVREFERTLIEWALHVGAGNKSEAARLLHIKRSTLADRMERCGLGSTPEQAPDLCPEPPARVDNSRVC